MDGVTTLFSQTDLISEFVQTVIGGSAHVVAQSYGARVGVWLAIRHPAVVRRLVLSAPAVLEGSRSAPPPAPGQPDAPPPALFGSQPPPFTAEQLRHIEAGARNMFSVMPTSPDRATTLQRLQEISAPTLLLWAGAEQVLDPASGPDTYAEAIPGLRVQVIERAPRLLTVMATDEYVAHTTEFLLAD
jgi:pimeloyl-ACP methyl ester carboxylesterase